MEVDVDPDKMEKVDNEQVAEIVEVLDDSMSELEDGELEDDSDDERQANDRKITYNNIDSGEKDRLSQRAERFGVVQGRKLPEDPDIRKLHIDMGVNNNTRTEALHLYGTDNMETQDVFHYFDYSAASVEWLTSRSCNVVWLDQESCAKALIKHSVKITGQPDVVDSDSEDEGSVNVNELRCALPPGGVWRKGLTRPFAPNLLIRYATISDKKEFMPTVPEALKKKAMLFPDGGDESVTKVREDDEDEGNPWSGLARQWGKYERNHRNRPGCVDARQLIREKELQKSLIKNDARDLLKYNRICRLQDGLNSNDRNSRKRSHLDETTTPAKRSRIKDENLQIIVENDSYRPQKKPTRRRQPVESSSSDSSSSSSSESSSSSSSSSDSSSDEESSDSEKPTQSLKQPWNKSSNKFKPSSSLLIEIDNDHYNRSKKRTN